MYPCDVTNPSANEYTTMTIDMIIDVKVIDLKVSISIRLSLGIVKDWLGLLCGSVEERE